MAVDYPKPPKPNPENRGMIPKDLRRQGISLPILPENSGDFRSKRKADHGVELAIFRSRVRRRTTTLIDLIVDLYAGFAIIHRGSRKPPRQLENARQTLAIAIAIASNRDRDC